MPSTIKKVCLIIGLLAGITSSPIYAQSKTDTGFNYHLSNASWIPGGDAILVTLFKIDKKEKSPPVAFIYKYSLKSRKFEQIDLKGGSITASPDGSKIAYVTRDKNKSDIYIYNMNTRQSLPLVIDSFSKYAPRWSFDGKMIAYNRPSTMDRKSPVQIHVIEIESRKSRKISTNEQYSNYSPVWSPADNRIVYYLEKGDGRDQIWLTDANGSFHKNLTNDTATHNYFPLWIDDNTIGYTQHSEKIATIDVDGKNKTFINELKTHRLIFDPKSKKVVYIVEEPVNKVLLFDWYNQISTDLFTLEDVIDYSAKR